MLTVDVLLCMGTGQRAYARRRVVRRERRCFGAEFVLPAIFIDSTC
jgi:hypothetical protein